MPNINISDDLIQELLLSLKSKFQDNIRKIEDLKTENEKLKDNMEQLSAAMGVNGKSGDASGKVSYQPQWTIFRKILFLMTEAGRPLSTREIVEAIIEKYEPGLASQRTRLVSNVSGVLSAKTRDGKLEKSENVLGENAYYPVEHSKLKFENS